MALLQNGPLQGSKLHRTSARITTRDPICRDAVHVFKFCSVISLQMDIERSLSIFQLTFSPGACVKSNHFSFLCRQWSPWSFTDGLPLGLAHCCFLDGGVSELASVSIGQSSRKHPRQIGQTGGFQLCKQGRRTERKSFDRDTNQIQKRFFPESVTCTRLARGAAAEPGKPAAPKPEMMNFKIKELTEEDAMAASGYT